MRVKHACTHPQYTYSERSANFHPLIFAHLCCNLAVFWCLLSPKRHKVDIYTGTIHLLWASGHTQVSRRVFNSYRVSRGLLLACWLLACCVQGGDRPRQRWPWGLPPTVVSVAVMTVTVVTGPPQKSGCPKTGARGVCTYAGRGRLRQDVPSVQVSGWSRSQSGG